MVGDFQKSDSDKQLTKLDKDKKAHLLKLDQEYKAGMLSKEQFEAQKSAIEANYDAKTRSLKKQAAEMKKEYKIAQAIIAGVLAVIEAAPNVPLQIATGIPEFARSGVVGAPKPATWREKVRRFASVGINSVAGVLAVGSCTAAAASAWWTGLPASTWASGSGANPT